MHYFLQLVVALTVHAKAHRQVHKCVYACMYACVHACVYASVCVCKCACVLVYARINKYLLLLPLYLQGSYYECQLNITAHLCMET
jgi:hypothetical protein